MPSSQTDSRETSAEKAAAAGGHRPMEQGVVLRQAQAQAEAGQREPGTQFREGEREAGGAGQG